VVRPTATVSVTAVPALGSARARSFTGKHGCSGDSDLMQKRIAETTPGECKEIWDRREPWTSRSGVAGYRAARTRRHRGCDVGSAIRAIVVRTRATHRRSSSSVRAVKEVDPNVARVCITSYFGLRFMVKKIEDFLVIFLPSKEPARRKALLQQSRRPKA
jgi:hypothetical protein